MGKSNKELWVITYYGTGMSPQRKTFDNEEEALATWANWVNDPYKGASSLRKETTIHTRYTYKGETIIG